MKEERKEEPRNEGKSEEINKQTYISPLTQLSQHMHPSHMITVLKTFNYRRVRIAHPPPTPQPYFYSLCFKSHFHFVALLHPQADDIVSACPYKDISIQMS
jgi:hypothetical protein